MRKLIYITIPTLLFSFHKDKNDKLSDLLNEMARVCDTAKIINFTISKEEQIGNNWVQGKSNVSYYCQSQKTIINTLAPQSGIDVSYLPNSANEASVHINFFPYITMDFDIYGYLLLRDQHHPVSHVNMHFFVTLLQNHLKKGTFQEVTQLTQMLHDEFDSVWQIKIGPIRNPIQYKSINKTVMFIDFIDKHHLNPYYTYELNNKQYEYGDSIQKGTKIKVALAYADSGEIIISKTNKLPVSIKFWINHKLYESYQFHNMTIK